MSAADIALRLPRDATLHSALAAALAGAFLLSLAVGPAQLGLMEVAAASSRRARACAGS